MNQIRLTRFKIISALLTVVMGAAVVYGQPYSSIDANATVKPIKLQKVKEVPASNSGGAASGRDKGVHGKSIVEVLGSLGEAIDSTGSNGGKGGGSASGAAKGPRKLRAYTTISGTATVSKTGVIALHVSHTPAIGNDAELIRAVNEAADAAVRELDAMSITLTKDEIRTITVGSSHMLAKSFPFHFDDQKPSLDVDINLTDIRNTSLGVTP